MKSKIAIISAVCMAVALAGIAIPAYNVYSKVKSWDNYIYPGVKIQDIDVSGKNLEEAQEILKDKFETPMTNKKVVIKVNDKSYNISYSKLNGKYDTNKVLNDAFNYGKDLSIYDKYKLIKNPVLKAYKLNFTYDSKPLDEVINTIKKAVNKNPVNATITKAGAGFNIIPDVDGYKLNEDQLKKDIKNEISGDVSSDTTIQANIETVKAATTKEKLGGVNTLISSFDTDYASISGPQRCNNIQLATKAINGVCLMPGDSFSFNGVVGQRTAEKGYQSAPVLIGNKADTGLGGGICQVSTTLYNAMLRAGVKATARAHHTLPSHYVTVGFDATVDYGNLDYQFKNTYNFPIYIEGSTNNGHVVFNIYSDGSLTKRTYKLVSEVYEEMQPTTKYVEDPTLPAGTTQIDQNPSVGHKVRVYMETYENGSLVSRDLVTNDTYNAVDQIIRRGTKK